MEGFENAIRNRHFNSLSKGREERPTESICNAKEAKNYSSEDDQQFMVTRSRKRIEKQQKATTGVTLKAETQIFAGHREQARRPAEEWTNQWRIWTGDTLRLHSNNTNHNVRGDGTSQKRKADYNVPA